MTMAIFFATLLGTLFALAIWEVVVFERKRKRRKERSNDGRGST